VFIGERAELTENGFPYFRRRFIEKYLGLSQSSVTDLLFLDKVRMRPHRKKDVTFSEIPIVEKSLFMSLLNGNSNTAVKPDF